jgi:hypothetical protein
MARNVVTAAANVSLPYQPSATSGLNSRTIVASGTLVTLNDAEYAALSATAFSGGTLLDAGNAGADGSASVARAAAVLPQNTTGSIYTVTGRVLVKRLIGEVTVVLTGTATNLKASFDPTGADGSYDLCTNLVVTSDAVGTLYSITGTVATAMKESVATHAILPANNLPLEGIVLTAGVITLTTDAANTTGKVKWDIDYIPLTSGASIVAA